MSVLGIVDPPECDERGVPLDWDRCRTCGGDGCAEAGDRRPCPACDGHGSLKAAALAALISRRQMANAMVASVGSDDVRDPHRCEDCGHPMSEGTWEVPEWSTNPHGHGLEAVALRQLQCGREPAIEMSHQHYSSCDVGCRHGGPIRGDAKGGKGWETITLAPHGRENVAAFLEVCPTIPIEASWRPVDVRTLGWPHDLRPEKLAVLCLRCWAARTRTPVLHDPDCPMTNRDPASRTSCICDRSQWYAEDGSHRTMPEGGS